MRGITDFKSDGNLRELTIDECEIVAGGYFQDSSYQDTWQETYYPPDPPPPSPPSPPPPPPGEPNPDSEWGQALYDLELFLEEAGGAYEGYVHSGGADQNSYYNDHSDTAPMPDGFMEMFGWMPNVANNPAFHFYDYLTNEMDLELFGPDEVVLNSSRGSVHVDTDPGNFFVFEINGRTIYVERHQSDYVSTDPDEIVVNGVTWSVHSISYDYGSAGFDYAPGSSGTPAPAEIFRTPGNHTINTQADLTEAQKAVLARIVDIGVARGMSTDDIFIAVKMAFQESSFNPAAVEGSHFGLFQYNQETWAHFGNLGSITAASIDAQINAFYSELQMWHTRYNAAWNSTQIQDSPTAVPRDISFEEYVKAKHEGGGDTWQFHSATIQTYIHNYEASARDLGLRMTLRRPAS